MCHEPKRFQKLDSLFVPKARRRLAGDAITGKAKVRISRPEGTPDGTHPALLPVREIHAASVPAVLPQANFHRTFGAEERTRRARKSKRTRNP